MTDNALEQFILAHTDSLLTTHRELCAIPAPSHHEEQRAAYCKSWLEQIGATGVYIDEALNVIFPINCEGQRHITVFAAHTDTVFPDTAPMPYTDDGEKIHCPGAGDDTASVSVLLHTAKYFVDNRLVPPQGVLFVLNACEEGLGNLKGTRTLFEEYSGRIARFISFDGRLPHIVPHCVGSHRYEVEARTLGGHSFSKFGNANAIAALAGIIAEIYKINVPKIGDSHTTYNVGLISGGTSINTIAQNATMLCEYRSDTLECFAHMKKEFERIFAAAASDEVHIRVTQVGDRPCGKADPTAIQALIDTVTPILTDIIDEAPYFAPASTDCNIPLSLGIPALCLGAYIGEGEHTREEWVRKDGFPPALEFAIRVTKKLTEV